MAYCTGCGTRLAVDTAACPSCGRLPPGSPPVDDLSPKSYGVAVALCGIFGVAGIHHFYLGNHLHGLFDLGLLIAAIVCFTSADPGYEYLALIAMMLVLIDVLHSVIVMYLLIVGKQRDGKGLLVTWASARR